jgi:hypothetical protein
MTAGLRFTETIQCTSTRRRAPDGRASMFKAPLAAASLAMFLMSAAHAQSWLPTAHRCGNIVAQQTGCASCAGAWPAISQCVAHAVLPHVSPDAINRCIAEVNKKDRSLPMAHDRIADVMQCLAPAGQ